jgi:murein DD-endopeptidase MepM/ murein hydrolase activator NlpD
MPMRSAPAPVGSRGIAVENAVYSRGRRFLVGVLVLVGLLAALAPVSPVAATAWPRMDWPTVGRVTQPWGCTGFYMEPARGDCPHFHLGIDVANSRGTPIRAAADGIIKYVGREPWYHGTDRAWVVVIDHGNGVKTLYIHLLVRVVDSAKPGMHVQKGQLIGYMGSTGRSTGPHLLFIVRKDGAAVDPSPYFPSAEPPRH